MGTYYYIKVYDEDTKEELLELELPRGVENEIQFSYLEDELPREYNVEEFKRRKLHTYNNKLFGHILNDILNDCLNSFNSDFNQLQRLFGYSVKDYKELEEITFQYGEEFSMEMFKNGVTYGRYSNIQSILDDLSYSGNLNRKLIILPYIS